MDATERIVSFLRSATEMICALGLADRLAGVTHECDFPPDVGGKPIVVRSALAIETMSQSEFDAAVTQRLRQGLSLTRSTEAAAGYRSGSDSHPGSLSGVRALGKWSRQVLNALPHSEDTVVDAKSWARFSII